MWWVISNIPIVMWLSYCSLYLPIVEQYDCIRVMRSGSYLVLCQFGRFLSSCIPFVIKCPWRLFHTFAGQSCLWYIKLHTFFWIWYILWQAYFNEVFLNINQMHFKYIFDIQRQKWARISLELDVNMHCEFLVEMFLIDNKVTVDCGLPKWGDSREYQKY